MAEALKVYEEEAHPSGESPPEAHKLYQVKNVSTLLKAGVPLVKLEHFRGLLEVNAYRQYVVINHVSFLIIVYIIIL